MPQITKDRIDQVRQWLEQFEQIPEGRRATSRVGWVQLKLSCSLAEAAGLVRAADAEANRGVLKDQVDIEAAKLMATEAREIRLTAQRLEVAAKDYAAGGDQAVDWPVVRRHMGSIRDSLDRLFEEFGKADR
jgi:hypothetical protein